MKKFIVVAHPRSGSTFVVERIVMQTAAFAPHVEHQELFNPIERLFNSCVLELDGSDEISMMNDFFQRSTASIAGFKTIPSFHFQWGELASRADIQFITIEREDLLSTIASMLICERQQEWKLPARQHASKAKYRFRDWFSNRRSQEMTFGSLFNRLLFDLRAIERLNSDPATIRLTCGELPAASPRLEAYFGGPISFRGFKPASGYTECFQDPDDFRETIVGFLTKLVRFHRSVPQAVERLLLEH